MRSVMVQDRYSPPSIPGRAGGFGTRPRWGLKTSFLFAMAVGALVCSLVALLVRGSVWIELELMLSVLAAIAFLFFFLVLYRGVRFDPQQGYVLGWVHPRRILSDAPVGDAFGVFTEAGAHEGLVGFLLGLVLDLVLSIVLVFAITLLIWLGVNALIAAVAIVFVPLYYLFRRSLRYLVVRGRSCRGKVLQSSAWAAAYTIVNFGWLYGMLVLGQFLASQRVHKVT